MRHPITLRAVTVALLLGTVAGVAGGQEPAPARIGASVPDSGGTIELVLAWRFHGGDDPAWARADLDDSGWQILEPRMAPADFAGIGWSGTGWFRRHLEVSEELWGTPLTLRMVQVGSSEVYLDGKLIGRFGPASVAAAQGVPAPPTVTFSTRPQHVLAVRYTLADPGPFERLGLDLGFVLTLEEVGPVLASRQAAAQRRIAFQVALTVIPLLLGFLHLALFGFYPKARENLFYALNMFAFAVIVFSGAGGLGVLSSTAAALLGRFSILTVVAAILFGLFTYYALRTRPFPRSWVIFVLLAPIPVVIGVLYPGEVAGWCWVPYFAATVVEIVRVEVGGRTVAPEGGRMLFWGLLVIYGAIALQALINVGLISSIEGSTPVYLVSILAAAISMSLFLARSFARTRLHLERRLEEVQALSGQILEQERTAHARELESRLLEAENARKSKELEAGRALQLSMLPPSVPEVEGLDIAASMTTASEVGGDYYDFGHGPDRSLVVAVGDATGHGVAAGIMVTAVKAVLATVGSEPRLSTMLGECDRVLREMNVRPLHMCLALSRITPRSVTVCSAAMPPVLVWRAETGRVEELGAGGLPLGGRLSPVYREESAALGPGDTLLLATDGFHELQDPDGNPLGFGGAKELLRGAAGVPAPEVVARLTSAVASWRASREQDDDITFVVVRAQP
jgi:serine phosphatase RsbU (regulator of sigma subunit)